MSDNQKISAVIITLNEERYIRTCINSLLQVADEILLIDSGSTDSTCAIAEELGAKCISSEWLGYAATKNKGNKIAAHNYILSIDADEELSAQLRSSILQVKEKGLNGAYIFDRHNYYLGKWIKKAGWHPDMKLRLFHKSEAKWEGDYVHETLKLKAGSPSQTLVGALNHYSISSIDQHKQTVRKYARLAAERVADEGKNLNAVKSGLSALFTFVKIYLFKGGILEGSRGFKIAKYSAWSKWLRWKYFKDLGK